MPRAGRQPGPLHRAGRPDGAARIDLDVLTPEDALALLLRLLGAARTGREPGAATELAEACARLPLALRIAAAHLLDHEDRSIRDQVRALRPPSGLDALEVVGDPGSAVRAAFALSYSTLDPGVRRVFRLVGLAPGPDVGAGGAAALAGIPEAEAEHALDRLAAAHLLRPSGPGRYSCHDLLRAYARECAVREDDGTTRAAALDRLFGWYLAGVTAAGRLLHPAMGGLTVPDAGDDPARDRQGREETAAGPPAVSFADRNDAAAWLSAERSNVLAAVGHCSEHGPRRVAWLLADRMRGYLWHSRSSADWRAAAQAGLAAATSEGDLRAQAALRVGLGMANHRQSRSAEAMAEYRAAADLVTCGGSAEARRRLAVSLHEDALPSGRTHRHRA